MQIMGRITAKRIAPAPRKPTSPSIRNDNRYNNGVKNKEPLKISRVTKSALEYGKICLSKLLKTKNNISVRISLTTEIKSKYLIKLFKIFLPIIDLSCNPLYNKSKGIFCNLL